MSSYQVEMLWRCTSCKHRNRGRDLVCVSCGSPKDGSEEYEMPDDVSREAAVTEAKLLDIATGGANWRCAYCGSDARRRDGECARCGGPQQRAASRSRAKRPAPRARATTPRLLAFYSTHRRAVLVGAPLGVLTIVAVVIAIAARNRDTFDAEVRGYGFDTTAFVQQWLPVRHEGFEEQKPADAKDVEALGDRVHHYDKIVIGTTQETYEEKVADGTTTETYTERESCGETCTETPRSCRNVCKSNKNGFATCNEVCTGGGKSCKTKYCSVTKTRSIPKYKMVTKTRTVPLFKSEPRYAPFFAWTQHDWVAVRSVRATGTGNVLPTWTPEALGIPPGTPASELRVTMDDSPIVWVVFEYERSGTKHTCRDRAADDAFRRLALHQKVRVRIGDGDGDFCWVDSPMPTTFAPDVAGSVIFTRRDLPPPVPKTPDAGADVGADATSD